MADQAVPEGGPKPAPVVIKKYANRRLYNTATSAYVTLDHLSTMVKEKTDFVVYDAKTDAQTPVGDAAIDDLKRKLDELQNQLAELSKKS